jgi:hypothetical protein
VLVSAIPAAVADPSVEQGSARRPSAAPLLWLWLATRVLLLVVALNPRLYSGGVFGDVRTYGSRVERMFQGELPYRDIAIEYPPGSVPFTLLPGLVVGAGAHYRLAFAVEMVLVDGVGLYAALRLARVADAGRRRIPLAYVLLLLAVGPLLVLRFDLVPAVCVLLAAAWSAEGRAGPAAAALGFGTAAKLFPLVLAPLLVLGLAPAPGWGLWRALRRTVPPFLAAFALPVAPALALSLHGTLNAVTYQTARGVQIESLPANAIDLLHLASGLPLGSVLDFGAYHLVSSLSAAAKTVSVLATALALVAAAALVGWRAWRQGGLRPPDWAPAFLIGVLAFTLPSRVLSPQYLVWLAALLAGLAGRRRARPALLALLAAAALTQAIYPFRYPQLIRFDPLDIGLLTVRNLLLVAIAAVVTWVFARPGSAPGATPGPAPAPGRVPRGHRRLLRSWLLKTCG